jgi:hypothetical protein
MPSKALKGYRAQSITKHMPNTSQLNQGQRQAFEKTLHESLRAAQRHHSTKEAEARPIAIQKVLESQEATAIAESVKQLTAQLESAEKQLSEKGFELRDDELRISYDAPTEIEEKYDAIVNELTASERAKVEAITAAIQKAWTVATLDEAKKVVTSFA